MKRTFMTGIAVVIVLLNFGQSIVSTDKQWNNLIHYYNFTEGTEHIKFTTDTIIDSLTYKKVERALDEYEQYWESYGYLRENPDKQVYYKINPGDKERMIYDLNVSLHDTLYASGLTTEYYYMHLMRMDSIQYYVHEIDSILIDQTWRKRINLTLWPDTNEIFEQWVDSLGSLNGMLHNRSRLVGCDYYFLLCYFEDGIVKYHNPDYSLCHYWPTGIVENTCEKITITIFPNPITTASVMSVKGIEDYDHVIVKFYDIFGKEILSKQVEKNASIHKEVIPPGLYLYRISGNERMIGSGKLIVQ